MQLNRIPEWWWRVYVPPPNFLYRSCVNAYENVESSNGMWFCLHQFYDEVNIWCLTDIPNWYMTIHLELWVACIPPGLATTVKYCFSYYCSVLPFFCQRFCECLLDWIVTDVPLSLCAFFRSVPTVLPFKIKML